jgi:hypothetical protein
MPSADAVKNRAGDWRWDDGRNAGGSDTMAVMGAACSVTPGCGGNENELE